MGLLENVKQMMAAGVPEDKIGEYIKAFGSQKNVGAPTDPFATTFMESDPSLSPFNVAQSPEKPTAPMPFDQLAQDTSPGQAVAIGAGKGLATIGRGLGLIDPADETEQGAMQALKSEHPIATGAGEIVGESAPFAVFPVGALPTWWARLLAGGAVAATEGGIIAKGTDRNVAQGATIGGTIGITAEALIPVIGRFTGAIIRKVAKNVPGNITAQGVDAVKKYKSLVRRATEAPLINAKGEPSIELMKLLELNDIKFSDLGDEAVERMSGKLVNNEEALIRRLQFDEFDLPSVASDVTQKGKDVAKTERLVAAPGTKGSKLARDVRLKQSEGISKKLKSLTDSEDFLKNQYDEYAKKFKLPTLFGTELKRALSGREVMLKGRKDLLYKRFEKNAAKSGGVPILVDGLRQALPGPRKLREISEGLSESRLKAFHNLMAEFGIDNSPQALKRLTTDTTFADAAMTKLKGTMNKLLRNRKDIDKANSLIPAGSKRKPQSTDKLTRRIEEVQKEIDAGPKVIEISDKIEPQVLSIESMDEFRKRLNSIIAQGDDRVPQNMLALVGDIKQALDLEVDEMVKTLRGPEGRSISPKIKEIYRDVKQARETVTKLKTEFSPQSIVKKLIDTSTDNVTDIVEASQVYKEIVPNSPPEFLQRTIASLKKTPQHKDVMEKLQSSTILDLVDSSYKADTLKIDGKQLISPIAFRQRLAHIGDEKMRMIFETNPQKYRDIKKIDNLFKNLISESGLSKPISSSAAARAARALSTFVTRIPIIGTAIDIALGAVGKSAKQQLKATPELKRIKHVLETAMPNLASILGTSAAVSQTEEE